MTHTLSLDIRFLKRFTRRLHQAGVPAHQLEGMVTAIARWMGYRCEIWSGPTAVFLALHRDEEAESGNGQVGSGEAGDELEEHVQLPMQLIRLRPGTINLADTTELYGMGDALISGRLTLQEAYQQLKKPRNGLLYPVWLRLLATGVISGSFVVMLSGSLAGALTATVAGLFLALLYENAGKALKAGGMEAIAAVLVTLAVYAAHHYLAGIDPASVIMSGLIVLMPGMSLTIAVTELSTDHLSSGSARLAGALIVILKLTLGVLIGTVMADWLGWGTAADTAMLSATVPAWAQWPALLASAVGFALIFNVRGRDVWLAVLAAVIGYSVSRAGVMAGGVEFGVMLAALVIALMGNLLGRALLLPASLIRVPGIILLVPGALGYRTISNVLTHGNPNSQETAILVATMVIALVGGLLVGNTIVPPRRHL